MIRWRMGAFWFLVLMLGPGCVSNPQSVASPSSGLEKLESADIYVAAASPRNPEHYSNFTIRVVAPDGSVASGTVGTSTPRYTTTQVTGGPSTDTSGDFRPEDPARVAPYPHVLFKQVRYNGTWHIYVNRTVSGTASSSETGLNPTGVNACIGFLFSDPNRTLRIFTGDRDYRTREQVSHAHLQFEYGLNYTYERFAQDSCKR